MSTEVKTPQEYAKNYPIAPNAGIYQAVEVGYVGLVNAKNGTLRRIYNLNILTKNNLDPKNEKTYMRNAILTEPADWTQKFQKGQFCDILVDGEGRIQKMMPVTTQQTIARVNADKIASKYNEMVDEETGELTESAPVAAPAEEAHTEEVAVTDTIEEEAPKAVAAEEVEELVAESEEDENPFK